MSSLRASRGFTLIEFAIALGVVAILAGITASAVSGLKQRGNYASTTGDVITALRRARSEAIGRGDNVIFIVDKTAGAWFILEDYGGDFDITQFDSSNPTSLGDRLVASGVFANGVTVGPTGGYGGAFPAPYAAYSSSADCSFCNQTAQNPSADAFGYLVFQSSGGALVNGAAATAATITVQGTPVSGGSTRKSTMTYLVVARTGSALAFDKDQ